MDDNIYTVSNDDVVYALRRITELEADRDRIQEELVKARAGQQNDANLAQHYFKELTQRTVDRDRWKALAVEAVSMAQDLWNFTDGTCSLDKQINSLTTRLKDYINE